jgi:hypothetical protein
MSCPTCIYRKVLALQFWPQRRPLYVRCRPCKDRRRARWYIASRLAIVLVSAVLAVAAIKIEALWFTRADQAAEQRP